MAENIRVVQCLQENGFKDKMPQGKMFDDMSETEKDEVMKNFVLEATSKLQDQNKRFKITVKKNYINDIL